MLLTAVAIPLFCLALALAVLHLRVRAYRARARRPTIGFLHPYCNDGGGGERVLWVAIRELIARGIAHPDKWRMVVYTGDRIPPAELRANAKYRFGVELPESLEFVQLSCRGWIEPSRYPVATLLGQALGSVLLAAEALLRAPPDVLVDTTGLAYCYPLVWAAGVRHLACYVHYPIVQSDMLGAVAGRQAAHNNAAFFARSALRSALKLAYYRLLLSCYAHAGSYAHTVMANGSWTAAHLRPLWRGAVVVVFPPCDTATLQALPLLPREERLLLSVAQFRPEKDHALQLQVTPTPRPHHAHATLTPCSHSLEPNPAPKPEHEPELEPEPEPEPCTSPGLRPAAQAVDSRRSPAASADARRRGRGAPRSRPGAARRVACAGGRARAVRGRLRGQRRLPGDASVQVSD